MNSPSKEILDYLIAAAKEYGDAQVKDAIKKFNNKATRTIASGVKVEKRKAIPKSWIRAAFERQHGICARCFTLMDMSEKRNRGLFVSGDHIDAHSTGGAHEKENICAVHLKCNSSKGNRTPYEDAKRTGKSLLEINKVIAGKTLDE